MKHVCQIVQRVHKENALGWIRLYSNKKCPPCEDCEPKKVNYPLIAKQYKEKVCNRCAYQMEQKCIPEDVQEPVEEDTCKNCPVQCPTPLKSIDDCGVPPKKECPKGDWECKD